MQMIGIYCRPFRKYRKVKKKKKGKEKKFDERSSVIFSSSIAKPSSMSIFLERVLCLTKKKNRKNRIKVRRTEQAIWKVIK